MVSTLWERSAMTLHYLFQNDGYTHDACRRFIRARAEYAFSAPLADLATP